MFEWSNCDLFDIIASIIGGNDSSSSSTLHQFTLDNFPCLIAGTCGTNFLIEIVDNCNTLTIYSCKSNPFAFAVCLHGYKFYNKLKIPTPNDCNKDVI